VGRQKTDIVGFHSGFDAGRLRKKTLMVTESRQLQGNVKNQNRTLTAEDAEDAEENQDEEEHVGAKSRPVAQVITGTGFQLSTAFLLLPFLRVLCVLRAERFRFGR
jgi:hypothetical protein